MKKGLSILLVAAALFGFYGGAANINDVLACKDYWEKASEESTANMNKLEDGLNQLKENEQAYLDGKDQLAEAEPALADGEAQYAQALEDYAAAPGKLAEGEAQLAEGYDSLKDLNKLISGLAEAKKHGKNTTKTHDTYWHDGFSHTVSQSVIEKIAAGQKTSDSPGLEQARQVITYTVNQKSGMLDTAANLGGMEDSLSKKILSAGSYAAFDKAVKSGVQPLKTAAVALNDLSAKASGAVEEKQGDFAKAKAALALGTEGRAAAKGQLETLQKGLNNLPNPPITDGTTIAKLKAIAGTLDDPMKTQILTIAETIETQKLGDTVGEAKSNVAAGIALYTSPQTAVATGIGEALAELGGAGQLAMVEKLDKDLYASLQSDLAVLTCAEGYELYWSNDTVYSQKIDDFAADMTTLAGALTAAAKEASATAATFSDWDSGYKTLAGGQATLASASDGIPFAFKNMLTNPTVKSAIKAYDKGLANILKKYTGSRLANEDMDDFDDDIVYLSQSVIPRALNVLSKVKSNAVNQLAAGEKTLAQAKADYAAAPGKLADAEQQLADGRQQLADGKAKLAEYEDGEQQARDGLSTLAGTEADLELESILDRLNGDDNFDDEDGHLNIDEGLNAVEVGRGYQADDGVLITNEIMARAVGSGALLGAGALAVLAAILSFLKKNKGAGVFAILAAAAGAFAAFYGTQAGTYFSSIAGSTVGATGWVAAGILGAVALVHSIVHFTAKKDA